MRMVFPVRRSVIVVLVLDVGVNETSDHVAMNRGLHETRGWERGALAKACATP